MPDAERTRWGDGPSRLSTRARLIVPAIIAFLVQVPASVWSVGHLRHAAGWQGLLHIALALAGPLALLAARRFPGPVVTAAAAFATVDVLITPVFGPPYIALAFAIIGAVVRGAATWAAASVAVGWAVVLLVGSLGGREWRPPLVVAATFGLAVCFAIAAFARARRGRLVAMREEAERQRQSAAERERVRIARELHDVIGHALSQISVQAGVGLHLFDRDPEQARAALANVKETSKAALDEVRGVLGVLRDGETPVTPEAGLGELPRLVAGAVGAGMQATLDDRLDGAEPDRATQLAGYRIVQEALTNALRHSHAHTVEVVLARLPERMLQITVTDDGTGLVASDVGAVGHSGILGMQERAALLGGSVLVLNRPGGGVEVMALLPWGTNQGRNA